MIVTYRVKLEGIGPIRFGRNHETSKLPKEEYLKYELRTWREKVHTNEDGYIIIPENMLKNALVNAAKFEGIKIPTDAKKTFTAKFAAGVMVFEPLVLKFKKEDQDLIMHGIFGSSKGIRGGTGTRVWKYYPTVREWSGYAEYNVNDLIITNKVLLQHLKICGRSVGFGVGRPINGGDCGRFNIKGFEKIKEIDDDFYL